MVVSLDAGISVRSLSLSEQNTLCKIVYSLEKHVFVRTLHQISCTVTVKRKFWRKFNRQMAPATSAISHLVQKFELNGNVCGNKKGVVGRKSQ
jgi:hypothetical protein